MTFTVRSLLTGVAVLFCIQTGIAHGDFHERLKKVTEEIRMNQDSAFLFFKRGKLYYHHEEYPAALKDLQQATGLGLEDTFCDLLYAKTYQQLDSLERAMVYLEKVVQKEADNVIALKTKAQIFFEQEHYQLSALMYEEVIAKSRRTVPENYLDAAKSWELLDTTVGRTNALNLLQQGISQIGPLFAFYMEIRDIHLRNNAFDQAITVQNKLIELSNRKEKALYEAAEICLRFNKKEAAKNYLLSGLDAVEKLPLRIQRNKAIIVLSLKMEEKLLQL